MNKKIIMPLCCLLALSPLSSVQAFPANSAMDKSAQTTSFKKQKVKVTLNLGNFKVPPGTKAYLLDKNNKTIDRPVKVNGKQSVSEIIFLSKPSTPDKVGEIFFFDRPIIELRVKGKTLKRVQLKKYQSGYLAKF